ncbi:Protein of unknown function [Gryllus bimaculatus]|nr:Protein of unknown function [Gryllus bimaculatus]
MRGYPCPVSTRAPGVCSSPRTCRSPRLRLACVRARFAFVASRRGRISTCPQADWVTRTDPRGTDDNDRVKRGKSAARAGGSFICKEPHDKRGIPLRPLKKETKGHNLTNLKRELEDINLDG